MKRMIQQRLILAGMALALVACQGVQPVAEAQAQPVVTQTTTITATTQGPSQEVAVVFATPEEAITHYLQGVAQNDLDKILQACAIHEMGANFKFDQYAERLGDVLVPNALMPTEYALYAEMNKVQLSSQILTQVKFLIYSLLSSEKFDGSVITGMDAAKVESFMQEVDPSQLATLTLEQITLPNATVMEDARYIENATQIAHIYGADESTERLALFSWEGKSYLVGFTLLRYGETWKISSQVSPLANTPATGTAQPMTREEFESMND